MHSIVHIVRQYRLHSFPSLLSLLFIAFAFPCQLQTIPKLDWEDEIQRPRTFWHIHTSNVHVESILYVLCGTEWRLMNEFSLFFIARLFDDVLPRFLHGVVTAITINSTACTCLFVSIPRTPLVFKHMHAPFGHLLPKLICLAMCVKRPHFMTTTATMPLGISSTLCCGPVGMTHTALQCMIFITPKHTSLMSQCFFRYCCCACLLQQTH